MSRRSVPPIDPRDLRDHADQARIDRIWERLEGDLAGARVEPPRRPSFVYVAAAAAVAAAFVGGVVVGRSAAPSRAAVAPTIRPVTVADRVDTDVFAAGSQGRTFELPGGGKLALSPGATVEMDHTQSGLLTLRLVQGEASVDTAGTASTPVSIVAGEARLSTRAGSALTVQRHGDEVDVAVAGGSVDIDSPAGSQQLRSGQRASGVPTRSAVASAPAPARRVHAPLVGLPRPGDSAAPAAAVAAGPEWLARYNAGAWDEAFDTLSKLPGGVQGAIDTAHDGLELTAIADIAWKADQAAAVRALTRIVDDLPQGQYAPIAAYKLATYYERKNPELARKYAGLSRSLSPNGNLDDDARCIQIRSERRKSEALRMAEDYLSKYPHGRCTEDAERITSGEATFADEDAPSDAGVGAASPSDAGPRTADAGPAPAASVQP